MTSLMLDTHALIWWFDGSIREKNITPLIFETTTDIYVSSVCALELATKFRIGKLPSVEILLANYENYVRDEGFLFLDVSSSHALRAGLMTGVHCDPFDRLLAAQSLLENIPVATRDPAIAELGAEVIW
jgi:PIN domain nuclease of toxin-antitoxin system